MKPSFYKGIVLGAVVSMLVLATTAAVAGTGIGGIFNLGQTNTVNATSALSGASVGPQLQVTNTGTGSGAQGIGVHNNSVAAAIYGRNGGAGPGVSGRADKRNNGVEGVSAGSGASGVYGANTSVDGFGVAGRSTGAAGIGVFGNNTGGGLGVSGKSTLSNGVQGTSAGAGSSGVFGENMTTSGFGIAGRAGSSGYAVFGDNTGGGWAGWFTGKTAIEGRLDLGGALSCGGCVSAGDITGKVNDSTHADDADSVGGQSPAALQTHGYYAYWDSNSGTYNVPPYNSTPTAIVSFTLPAGTYVVNAAADFINDASYPASDNRRTIECWVEPRYGTSGGASLTLQNGTGDNYGSVAQTSLVVLGQTTAVQYKCVGVSINNPSNVRGGGATITAIKLDQLN
jgi:hypothetical protein